MLVECCMYALSCQPLPLSKPGRSQIITQYCNIVSSVLHAFKIIGSDVGSTDTAWSGANIVIIGKDCYCTLFMPDIFVTNPQR